MFFRVRMLIKHLPLKVFCTFHVSPVRMLIKHIPLKVLHSLINTLSLWVGILLKVLHYARDFTRKVKQYSKLILHVYYPNSKWPPGSAYIPSPCNIPRRFPRRTHDGWSSLTISTPTPTFGRVDLSNSDADMLSRCGTRVLCNTIRNVRWCVKRILLENKEKHKYAFIWSVDI